MRLVATEALHVTLVFLGSTPQEDVDRLWAAASGAAADRDPPLLQAAGVVGVPRRRPRLLALELDDQDGRAAAIQAVVAGALADAELFDPEERPFWPHLTLARARGGARLRAPEGGPSLAPFVARELVLYRSVTAPTGARYEALERLTLG
jgi:2'-5' RNA ligase